MMKYDTNQTSLIASFLYKAKQCKAHFNEWLDPSIKNTEWSAQEDGKLLHLSKMMPSQWNTTAPIIGVCTTTRCIERLRHTKKDCNGADDIIKSKFGKLNPGLESKPALLGPKTWMRMNSTAAAHNMKK